VISVTQATIKLEASWLVKDEYSLKNPTDIVFGMTPTSGLICNKARVGLLLKDYKYIYSNFGVVSASFWVQPLLTGHTEF
jgi:hypothetical protein